MDRKELVQVLGKHLDIKPKYLGVPSFAYQVGDFTVDREGKIKNKEGDEVELAEILNPNEEIKESLEEVTEEEMFIEEVNILIPLEGHNLNTLKNLVNMIFSKQDLINKVFELDEDIISEREITKLNASETLEDFTENLKTEYIKIEGDNISFTLETDIARSASLFFGLLNEKAKELKYASSKQIITDNAKYAFRTWIMRLGMIGTDYKEARKELLQNLNGNSAFRRPGENHD